MKIAQLAPLMEHVPPAQPSDAAHTLSHLIKVLEQLGHQVTLFASADCRPDGRLDPVCAAPLSHPPPNGNQDAVTCFAIERVLGHCADDFDVIHSHLGIDAFPLPRRSPAPVLATVHERLDLPEYQSLFRLYRGVPLVSTSNIQWTPLAEAAWQWTIYSGPPSDLYRFNPDRGHYLAYVGPFKPGDGFCRAADLAGRVGMLLRVAPSQGCLPELPEEIQRVLAEGRGEWVGALSEEEKNDFLGDAAALVCTDSRPGLSSLRIAEALACGTPILALKGTVAEEMIEDNVTGFVCDNLDEMVEVFPVVQRLPRRACRVAFEARFSAERMAEQYISIYEQLIAASRSERQESFSPMLQPQAAGAG